jgi:hypothetical protein
VKSVGTPERIGDVAGLDTLDQLCDLSSQLNGAHPWLGEFAVPVRTVVPVRTDVGLTLVDRERKGLPATCPDIAMWTLLALSGGNPVDVTVGFDGARLRPLGVIVGGAFTSLTAAEGAAL